jgi:hypothetical protein
MLPINLGGRFYFNRITQQSTCAMCFEITDCVSTDPTIDKGNQQWTLNKKNLKIAWQRDEEKRN